ncbi:cupin domain-containing protein [Microbulbifer sp. THAF38]|uniref:cupin domain-containing protein n=1 Tax=Microbulbifer sp. THAF38 TaxID=2587856 RepID=UPI001267B5AA|nr:cupin domain-containing protein [Microbulbifer sp. THAF38]QFT56526.1 Cupin domain protein [Microbulbifer sp. THAF38]
MINLFENLPENTELEHFQDIIKNDAVRIERIVSHGQSSPEEGWYDQGEHEWVLVLSGSGVLEFDCGETFQLIPGDCLLIEAGRKHRVVETSPNEATVWLAVFYH